MHGEHDPWISRPGLSVALIWSIVSFSCEMPSKAKNSHCTGTSTACAATMALRVSRLSEGGQSIQKIGIGHFGRPGALLGNQRGHRIAQAEGPVGLHHHLRFEADQVGVWPAQC